MRSRELVIAALLLAGPGGCMRTPDPHPPSMRDVQSDAHGAYVVVHVRGRGVHAGELIAIDEGRVWVLDAENVLIATYLDRVVKLEIHRYKVENGGVAAWGVAGTVSTLSHGFVLIISAPVWIIAASATAASHSRSARLKYNGKNSPAIASWARFPQGLPRGVTAAELVHGRRASRPPPRRDPQPSVTLTPPPPPPASSSPPAAPLAPLNPAQPRPASAPTPPG